MIRHFKWHKKRDESLQHGFMRYSPIDDCTEKFGPCTHNGRQTHYHCLQVRLGVNRSGDGVYRSGHGFMRYSPIDDCTEKFGPCTHNGRQTHYHCLQVRLGVNRSGDGVYRSGEGWIRSVQHGFMRYSPIDDYTDKFGPCTHNGRQTHYHCLQVRLGVNRSGDGVYRSGYVQHGFMRYSPIDDCTERFGPCTHNGRQTHYHCLQVRLGVYRSAL